MNKALGLFVLAVFLLPSGSTAMAADVSLAVMKNYFGNTLVCRSASMQCHIWFQPDGSYRRFEVMSGSGENFELSGFEGKYQISQKNGAAETCLAPRGMGGPMGRKPTECYALASHKIGDSWDEKTPDGASIHFSLQRGHHVNGGQAFLEQ